MYFTPTGDDFSSIKAATGDLRVRNKNGRSNYFSIIVANKASIATLFYLASVLCVINKDILIGHIVIYYL